MNDSGPNRRYYGKYRGTVVSNTDPEQHGRLTLKVPDVLGDNESSWALPCVPYAGSGVGFFAIPPQNASVWVEFEGGNPDYPIWTGCFWDGNDSLPASPALAEKKVWKTQSCTLTLDDTQGASKVSIETGNLKLVMDSSQGIELSNGTQKIKISSSSVSINDSALEVT